MCGGRGLRSPVWFTLNRFLFIFLLAALDCGPPPTIGNASVTSPSTKYEMSVTYTCKQAHFFDQTTDPRETTFAVSCTADGTWQPSTAQKYCSRTSVIGLFVKCHGCYAGSVWLASVIRIMHLKASNLCSVTRGCRLVTVKRFLRSCLSCWRVLFVWFIFFVFFEWLLLLIMKLSTRTFFCDHHRVN